MNGSLHDGSDRNDARRAAGTARPRVAIPRRLLHLLYVAVGTIGRPGAVSDGLDPLLEAIEATCGADHGFLATAAEDGSTLETRASTGLFAARGARSFEPGAGLVGQVWREGRSVVVADYPAWSGRGVDLVAEGAQSIALVPIPAGDVVVGVLGVAEATAGRPFDADDLEILEAAARIVALVLAGDAVQGSARAARRDREDEDRIARSIRARERRILDRVPVSILVKDRDNRVVQANEAAAEALGLPLGAVEDRYLWEIDPRHAAHDYHRDLEVLESGRGVCGERERREGADGNVRWWSVDRDVLRDDDGGREGVVVVARDVTEELVDRDRIEASQRAEARARRIRDHAVASIAQNVRGPLGRVREALERGETGDSLRADLEVATQWIDDLLDFERVEAGNQPVESVPLDVGGLVEDVAELVARAAGARGNEIAVHVDATLDGRLAGDGVRIRQILVQLLAQAVRATRDGEILLTARSVMSAPEHCEVRFEVHASAWALPPHQIEALFGPYLHGDDALDDRGDPGAVGLALAHRMIEMLGGTVGADHRADSGAGFWCSLPLERATHGATGPVPVVAPTGLRVLTVVARPTVAVVLDRQLRELGAHVERCVDLEAARAALDGARDDGWAHDAILVDTGTDPTAALAWTRALDAPTRACVTLLVPFGRPVARSGLGAGHPFLAKPVRRERLAALLIARAGIGGADPPVTRPLLGRDGVSPPRILLADADGVERRLAAAHLRELGCVVVESDVNALDGEALAGRFDLALAVDGAERTACSPTVDAVRRLDGAHGHTPVVVMAPHLGAIERDVALASGADASARRPRSAAEWADLVRTWARGASRPAAAVDSRS